VVTTGDSRPVGSNGGSGSLTLELAVVSAQKKGPGLLQHGV
jgi:hypothetical protein